MNHVRQYTDAANVAILLCETDNGPRSTLAMFTKGTVGKDKVGLKRLPRVTGRQSHPCGSHHRAKAPKWRARAGQSKSVILQHIRDHVVFNAEGNCRLWLRNEPGQMQKAGTGPDIEAHPMDQKSSRRASLPSPVQHGKNGRKVVRSTDLDIMSTIVTFRYKEDGVGRSRRKTRSAHAMEARGQRGEDRNNAVDRWTEACTGFDKKAELKRRGSRRHSEINRRMGRVPQSGRLKRPRVVKSLIRTNINSAAIQTATSARRSHGPRQAGALQESRTCLEEAAQLTDVPTSDCSGSTPTS